MPTADDLSTFFLPFKGKEFALPPELQRLHHDINFETLHVRRPSKFLFFCGGAMASSPSTACSLRHYLLNERKISSRIRATVVLAEKANHLYRDSGYGDLITFEEDIARIAALILVIAESAGSLAELGAFASTDAIRRSLAILIRTNHYDDAETFVRYGPVEKTRKENAERIGVYPWKTNRRDILIKSSASPHVRSITSFLNRHVDKVRNESLFNSDERSKLFYIILWIVYLSNAIFISKITEIVQSLRDDVSHTDVRNKLYCMKIAGWTETYTYENKTYWYAAYDVDPFSRYSFIDGLPKKERDTARRKADVATALQRELKVPGHVRRVVMKSRKSP